MNLKSRLNRLLAKIPLPRLENGLPYVIIENGIITHPKGLTLSDLDAIHPKPYQIIISGVIKDET